MNIKFAILTAAYAVITIGSAPAAAQPVSQQAVGTAITTEQPVASPVIGFGSGTGMGAGSGAGSASSLAGGFGSSLGSSGGGSQIFGGGFTQQQAAGSGPLSTRPATTSAGSGSAMARP